MSHPHFPEPPVKYTGYSDLYFATGEQMRSAVTVGGYDRGELSLSPGRAVFTGMRFLVDCPNVTAARLVRKSFPWAAITIVAVVAALLAYMTSPTPFTWRQPAPYCVAAIFLIVCVRQWREEWVEVVYHEGGQPRRAYFRRDPHFFGSSAARTRQLHHEISAKAVQPTTQDR